MNIPSTLRAGDTIAWDESISNYPATDGWTLAFALQATGKALITITAATSGSDYAIAITSTTSKTYSPGKYFYQAYVYKGTPPAFTSRVTIETGQVEILPDITQATSSTDLRSNARKNLDMIEARLSGDTSPDVMGYSIAGRSLSKRTAADLIMMRSYWKTEVERELIAEGQAKGLDVNPNRIGVRFNKI